VNVKVPPLRVPSIYPGKWVYLRGASVMFGALDRTHGCSLWVASAHPLDGAFVATIKDGIGLKPWRSPGRATLADAVAALESHLTSLGGEPVPDGQWPTGCEGPGYHPDYPPVTLDDLYPEHTP